MVFNLLPLKREDAFFRALSIKYEKLTKKQWRRQTQEAEQYKQSRHQIKHKNTKHTCQKARSQDSWVHCFSMFFHSPLPVVFVPGLKTIKLNHSMALKETADRLITYNQLFMFSRVFSACSFCIMSLQCSWFCFSAVFFFTKLKTKSSRTECGGWHYVG